MQNPQKSPRIQLDSEKDLHFVFEKVEKSLGETVAELMPTQAFQQVFEGCDFESMQPELEAILSQSLQNVMDMTGLNCTVQGQLWNGSALDNAVEEFEPVNDDLVQQLTMLQVQVDQAMLKLTEKRRRVPEAIRNATKAQYAETLKTSLQPIALEEIPEPGEISIDPETIELYQDSVANVRKCVQELGALNGKMDRFRTFVVDELGSDAGYQAHLTRLSGGGGAADETMAETVDELSWKSMLMAKVDEHWRKATLI